MQKVIDGQIKMEDYITSDEYYVTFIDIYLLSKEYDIPIIFLCNTAIDISITNSIEIKYIICNINKINDNYYFLKVPSVYSRDKKHNYKLMFNNQSFIFNINTDLQDSQSYKLYSNLKKHLQFYTDVLADFINNYNIIKATNTVYKQKKYKKSVAEANAEEEEPAIQAEAAIEEPEEAEPAIEEEEAEEPVEEEEPEEAEAAEPVEEEEAVKAEEAVQEEPVQEEAVEAEEAAQEEPVQEEPEIEAEAAQEEPVQEEPVQEEPVEEEPVEPLREEKAIEPLREEKAIEAEEQLDVAFPNKTKKYKRCPNGERRNKVTKKCEPNKK
jgi:hypothetical protein